MNNDKSRLGKIIQYSVWTITIIGTLWGVWWATRKPKIDLSVVSMEMLSQRNIGPNLTVNINAKGRKISRLWIMRLRAENTGSLTLVSTGPSKNIIGDEFLFEIDDKHEIVGLTAITQTNRGQVSQLNKQQYSIYFSQWRVNEYMEYIIYASSVGDSTDIPLYRAADRYLINGEISFIPFQGSRKTRGLATYLGIIPNPIKVLIKVIGITVFLGMITMFLYLLASSWKKYYRLKTWHGKYFHVLQAKLHEIKEFDHETRKNILRKPHSLPDNYWDKLGIPQCPSDGGWDSLRTGIMSTIIIIVMDAIFMFGVMGYLIYI